MGSETKKKRRPHRKAFKGETPCASCESEWLRTGLVLDQDTHELEHVTACAECNRSVPSLPLPGADDE